MVTLTEAVAVTAEVSVAVVFCVSVTVTCSASVTVVTCNSVAVPEVMVVVHVVSSNTVEYTVVVVTGFNPALTGNIVPIQTLAINIRGIITPTIFIFILFSFNLPAYKIHLTIIIITAMPTPAAATAKITMSVQFVVSSCIVSVVIDV
jgi:hypothetical protein